MTQVINEKGAPVAVTINPAFVALKEAQKTASEKRAAFLASLPIASNEQVAACVQAAREVDCPMAVANVAAGLNQEFVLNEFQRDQLAAAKAEHRVIINAEPVKLEAAANIGKAYLRSYKLRMTKSGRLAVCVSGLL